MGLAAALAVGEGATMSHQEPNRATDPANEMTVQSPVASNNCLLRNGIVYIYGRRVTMGGGFP